MLHRGRVRQKAKQKKTADIPEKPENRPFLAPWSGFEPLAFRLGAQDVTSYTVIARDFQCRKTLENTGFFSDWPVIRYRLVMPDSC